MSFQNRPNVSDDLIWQVTRSSNTYLVKRGAGGRQQFSRDPLNPTNEHARKYAGYANSKAIGVQSADGKVVVTAKKPGFPNAPKKNINTTFNKDAENTRVYNAIASATTNYRNDLIPANVARASAIKATGRSKAKVPTKTPRGAKAAQLKAASA